jgi:hypothetical protein
MMTNYTDPIYTDAAYGSLFQKRKEPFMPMTAGEAIKHAYKLFEIWIGPIHGRGPDFSVTSDATLARIEKSMRDEYRFIRTKPERAAVTRETRGLKARRTTPRTAPRFSSRILPNGGHSCSANSQRRATSSSRPNEWRATKACRPSPRANTRKSYAKPGKTGAKRSETGI